MEPQEFERLLKQTQLVGKVLGAFSRTLTDEDVDLQRLVHRYPVAALGVAALTGAAVGLWVGRRGQPRLPPPPPASQNPIPDLAREWMSKLQGSVPPIDPAGAARDFIDRKLPEGVEKAREYLPDVPTEELTQVAREWIDTVIEPSLSRGIDTAWEKVSETRWGSVLRDVMGDRRRSDEGEEPENDL